MKDLKHISGGPPVKLKATRELQTIITECKAPIPYIINGIVDMEKIFSGTKTKSANQNSNSNKPGDKTNDSI
jgi:hypothetical protein